jgi:Antitoxin MazE-like
MNSTRDRRNVARRARKHRESLRAAGLRPIEIWIPDVTSKNFATQARHQSLAIARSEEEKEDLALIESVGDLDGT